MSTWIRVGKFNAKVFATNYQGNAGGKPYYYYDNYKSSITNNNGWHLGTRDWYDENGVYFPFRIANTCTGSLNEVEVTMPVPDDEDVTIHRYYKYQPPTITVDGERVDDLFPMLGDEVNPDKINGTADIMLESWIRTWMGVDIHQKVLAWSQNNHDDYAIWDWTFTNTGNVDLDDEIELQNQSLKDVYFMSVMRAHNRQLFFDKYGQIPGDSLRIQYNYYARESGAKDDNVGRPDGETGFLVYPQYVGRTFLHVDTSPDDPSNNPSQPQMTGIGNPQWLFTKIDASKSTEGNLALLYNVMSNGIIVYNGTPEMEGTYPGTHHSVSMANRGIKYNLELGFGKRGQSYSSIGPYDLTIGESIRIVWADVAGSISPEKGWEVGTAWKSGEAMNTWEGIDIPDNMPPQYQNYPDLAPTENDMAKDHWVFSGKDSLFNNAWAAQWNVLNNYDIPIPPTPPSVEVASRPDRVDIMWGNESESAPDFAGYRVYRAIGNPGPAVIGGELIGSWHPIFECGKGTANPLTYSYEDTEASRGIAYFYYVTAFDDGIGNVADVHGRKESLESGGSLNMTTKGAYLTRAAGTLSTVRVVPNPFNIGAETMQYPGEPDKIMFLDVPGYCTIKIYSESGDLVKTLYHTDGSGDESWGVLLEEHSSTEIGQKVVSGIYIALIEENNEDGTPTGNTHFVKFVIVR